MNTKPREWSFQIVIANIARALIFVGLAPVVFFYGWYFTHGPVSLSVPLSLKQGEYTSPTFRTGLDGEQGILIALGRIRDGQDSSCFRDGKVIESDVCRGQGRLLDADWKIVNNRGELIRQGSYKDRIYSGSSSEDWIGRFVSKRGSRQRIILTLHSSIEGYETAHPRLEIHGTSDPEGAAFQGAYAIFWALIVATPGVIVLLVLRSRRAGPRTVY